LKCGEGSVEITRRKSELLRIGGAVQCIAREEEEKEKRFLICDMALISLTAVGVVGVGVGLYSINSPLSISMRCL
jgi:hypothetical protein